MQRVDHRHDLHFIAEASTSNPVISAWSVGMQIHHALLATIHISQSLADSTPREKKQSFSAPRSAILLTGKIPRSRGKVLEDRSRCRRLFRRIPEGYFYWTCFVREQA